MARARRKPPSAAVPLCSFWASHGAMSLCFLPMGGGLAVWSGLMTWGSASRPANGRACAGGGCADVQTVSTASS